MTAPVRFGAFLRLRVFLRSLLLQASWNREGMQNLGFAYVLYPALCRLYPEGPARVAALQRHLDFFNCHPYLAAAVVGGALRLEERVAMGEVPAEAVPAYKRALGPPFAALGDAFFWGALRPATGLAGVLVALIAPSARPVWALATFLGLYNAIHLSARAWLFVHGYASPEGVVGALGAVHLPDSTSLIKATAATLAGAVAATLAVAGGWPIQTHHAVRAAIVVIAAYAILPKLGPYFTALAALAVGVAIGVATG